MKCASLWGSSVCNQNTQRGRSGEASDKVPLSNRQASVPRAPPLAEWGAARQNHRAQSPLGGFSNFPLHARNPEMGGAWQLKVPPEPSSWAESTRGQGPQTPAGNSGRGPDCADTPGPRSAPGGQPLGDSRGCFKPATECLRVSQPKGHRDPFIRARLITVGCEPQLWRGSDLP